MHPLFAGLLGLGFPELIVITGILGALLLLAAIPAILACVVLSRIPPPFRKQEPGLAFLLIIPLFGIIWSFFVHPRVAQSLRAYYEAHGVNSHGDCGRSMALALCICGIGAFIPFLGLFAGVAGLILMILFYVKAFDLSARIPKSSNNSPPPASTTAAR